MPTDSGIWSRRGAPTGVTRVGRCSTRTCREAIGRSSASIRSGSYRQTPSGLTVGRDGAHRGSEDCADLVVDHSAIPPAPPTRPPYHAPQDTRTKEPRYDLRARGHQRGRKKLGSRCHGINHHTGPSPTDRERARSASGALTTSPVSRLNACTEPSRLPNTTSELVIAGRVPARFVGADRCTVFPNPPGSSAPNNSRGRPRPAPPQRTPASTGSPTCAGIGPRDHRLRGHAGGRGRSPHLAGASVMEAERARPRPFSATACPAGSRA